MLLLFVTSCERKTDQVNISEPFFQEFIADDFKVLDEVLTTEYAIDDLKCFFEKHNTNESIGFNVDMSSLTITKVHQYFPIEIIRTNGYSVYKVREGGYFYVFWVKPFCINSDITDSEPSVYFSAYLSASLEESIFDSLKMDVSTAYDVSLLDPSFELSFLSSSGICSYSYLNKDSVMRIIYTYHESFSDRNTLICKSKDVIARDKAPSRYSSILLKDLP